MLGVLGDGAGGAMMQGVTSLWLPHLRHHQSPFWLCDFHIDFDVLKYGILQS